MQVNNKIINNVDFCLDKLNCQNFDPRFNIYIFIWLLKISFKQVINFFNLCFFYWIHFFQKFKNLFDWGKMDSQSIIFVSFFPHFFLEKKVFHSNIIYIFFMVFYNIIIKVYWISRWKIARQIILELIISKKFLSSLLEMIYISRHIWNNFWI